MVRATSTSFINGTGLKKCRPTNWPGRPVAVMISVIEIEDVLLAKIAEGFTIGSIAANIFRFSPRFSITASTTKSQPARSSFRVVPFRRSDLARRFADRAFGRKFVQGFSDGRETLFNKSLLHFQHGDVESGRRRHLRDSRAHQPATEHSDFFDFHQFNLC